MQAEQTQWDSNSYKVKLTYAEAKLLSEYSDAYITLRTQLKIWSNFNEFAIYCHDKTRVEADLNAAVEKQITTFNTKKEKNIMEKANQNIRKQIKELGIYQWQLADVVGISANNLSAWMRHELSGERLARVQAALDELKKQQANSRQ